jgi:nitroimidazol reductase NimA-like FMN-containing flavoprotein (pyridoxamine 5'-phosphate oxidase superfamily)
MWIDQRGSEILQTPECLQLLAVAAKEDHVGRLAVIDGQSPLVVPLNFTFHDRTVLVLIGPGLLSMLVPGSLVAFEVDRVEPDREMAWSVLVRGLATKSEAEDGIPEAALPKPWVPQPGEELISIRPDVVTGRRFRLVATNGHGSEQGTSGVPTV